MAASRPMSKLSLQDGAETFELTVLEVNDASRVVLFAVGGGGDPQRHLPLLTSLVERGCTVVAPHFERLPAPVVTEQELLLRGRRLKLALDTMVRPGQLVAGVGHSIGTTMLLALAGAELWMRSGKRLAIARDERLDRLALMTPATGFFRAPGALDGVSTPLLVWAGTEDDVTPPAQAEFLRDALGARVPVELRLVPGAGHFSFMNSPPPGVVEPLRDRNAFLDVLATEIGQFVTE